MNDDHLSESWKKVAGMYYLELADALKRRAWKEVEGMTTPEFVAAVRRENWRKVGDEYGDVEGAHAIRDAMKLGTEDDVFDAIMDGDKDRLSKIARAQSEGVSRADFESQDKQIGLA